MTTALDRIVNDHQHMVRLLDFLDYQMSGYREGSERRPSLKIIIDALDYLHHYPDVFHHPLESKLITRLKPRLTSRGQRIKLELIEAQHRQMVPMTAKLLSGFNAVASGQVMPINLLLANYTLYSDLQREHMALEDQFLIPAFEALLTPEELSQIDDDLKLMPDPLFGAHLWTTYKRLYQHVLEWECSVEPVV